MDRFICPTNNPAGSFIVWIIDYFIHLIDSLAYRGAEKIRGLFVVVGRPDWLTETNIQQIGVFASEELLQWKEEALSLIICREILLLR